MRAFETCPGCVESVFYRSIWPKSFLRVSCDDPLRFDQCLLSFGLQLVVITAVLPSLLLRQRTTCIRTVLSSLLYREALLQSTPLQHSQSVRKRLPPPPTGCLSPHPQQRYRSSAMLSSPCLINAHGMSRVEAGNSQSRSMTLDSLP